MPETKLSLGQAIDQIIGALDGLGQDARTTAISAACKHLKIKQVLNDEGDIASREAQEESDQSGGGATNVYRATSSAWGEAHSAEFLTRARLGQGAFRILVTDAYARRCAITGERTLPVLDAAHIKPFVNAGPNQIANGLLLRSDLHRLFDLGFMTITPDLSVKVSGKIKEKYENGREYYALDGRELVVIPTPARDRPSSQYLEWHNSNIFLG